MNIEMTDLDMILNHLETTSLEQHDDYTSKITYKDQKILYKYIKNSQQKNQQLKIQISAREEEYRKLENNWNKLKGFIVNEIPEEEFVNNEYYVSILDKMVELERDVSDE